MEPRQRPRIGVSACLLGDAVRYDGDHRRQPALVAALDRRFEVIAVCPEMEFGLGVPRPPVQLERHGRVVRLVQPSSGRDLTEPMDAWAGARAEALLRDGLDGFVFKARSPSCGVDTVAVHEPGGELTADGRGRFAAALIALAPGLPVAEEVQIEVAETRDRFLDRVAEHFAERIMA